MSTGADEFIPLLRAPDAAPGPQPSIWRLLQPKRLSSGRRMKAEGNFLRVAVMGFVGLVFFLIVFGMVWRVLDHFRETQGVGDLLASKLLGMILLAFFAILLLSNVITSLSSFFLSRDLELLSAAPVDGFRIYASRYIETLVNSSWMMVILLVPILIAFGVSYGFTLQYVVVAIVAVIAFIMLPAVIGAAVTLVLVNVFPARRARDILALIALFGAAALISMFRLLRPEQLSRPEGFRNLVDFVAELRTPQSVWLPSEWVTSAIMSSLGAGDAPGDLFPLALLLSTAAAFFVLGATLHGRLYREGYSRSQEGAEIQEGAGAKKRISLERLLSPIPVTARTLVAKDIRTFFRDTQQWSQLILLVVLVVVYVYNIKVLPLFQGEEVGFFLINVISFLNLGLAGFVLAAIAARFIFPAISLEGRTLWLLRSSPLDLRSLLWSKFWVGITPLLILAVALTLGTNIILRISGFMMVMSLVTIVVMTFVISAMALGFGAAFPKFDTDNSAEIPTSFGGMLFMMTSIAYLGVIVALEAWPVYAVLRARAAGTMTTEQWTPVLIGLGIAALISAAALVMSLRIAVSRVEALDH